MDSEIDIHIAYKRIAGAVLLQAVKDWQLDDYRQEVATFLSSNWGKTVAGLLDLNSQSLNEKLLLGNFSSISTRAPYR